MKLIFEISVHPGDYDAADEILNALNDDGLRVELESSLALAIESVMWFDRHKHVRAKLKEWDVK